VENHAEQVKLKVMICLAMTAICSLKPLHKCSNWK